ncbi:MAG: LptF/LptG family permease, partial [Thermoguttaceae bacterium]
ELVMESGDLLKKNGSLVNMTIDNTTGTTIQGDRFLRAEQTITSPNFVLSRPVVKQTTYLKAKNAFYKKADAAHPAGFLLDEMINPPDIVNGDSLYFKEKPILITHKDAPEWIDANACFVVSNVPFNYLASNDAWRQYASTWELIQTAQNGSLDVGNRIYAMIHSRLIQPILDVTLLFLGLPILFFGGDRNVFKAMGMSGLIVLAFLVVRESSMYLGANSDMPILGAWLPLFIFVPIAINQLLRLRET